MIQSSLATSVLGCNAAYVGFTTVGPVADRRGVAQRQQRAVPLWYAVDRLIITACGCAAAHGTPVWSILHWGNLSTADGEGVCLEVPLRITVVRERGFRILKSTCTNLFLLSPGFRTSSLHLLLRLLSPSGITRYSLQTFRISVTSSRRGSSVTLHIMRVIKNYIIYTVPSGASHAGTQQLRFLADLDEKHHARSVARQAKAT